MKDQPHTVAAYIDYARSSHERMSYGRHPFIIHTICLSSEPLSYAPFKRPLQDQVFFVGFKKMFHVHSVTPLKVALELKGRGQCSLTAYDMYMLHYRSRP
jgi:hypothetical protein